MIVDTPDNQGANMSDGEGKEIDATIAGQHIRAKGYRLMDLLWIAIFCGVGWYVYQVNAQAQADKQSVATSVKEANMAVVQALKESNANTVEAIKMLTMEQKKSTSAMRETACLLDPAMKNKADARDFCKRMTRNE